jgi:glycosyltransferase involved in cell wall biosynthesis
MDSEKIKQSTPEKPLLSIIICTYNRAALLEKCLDSIMGQESDLKDYEFIVVDNNSTDNTSALALGFVDKLPYLKYVIEEKQGLSNARNRGAEEAKGQYLAYIDDDAKLSSSYLLSVKKTINENQPDILGGPVYPYYSSPKPRWFKDKFEIRKHEETSGFSTICRVSGGNFIIKREILFSLGMFDPEFGIVGNTLKLGEEAKVLDDYRRMTPKDKHRVYYDLDCFIEHYVPEFKMRAGYVLRRHYLSGKTAMILTPRSTSKVILELPLRVVWYAFRGIADRDIIGGMRNICFQIGLLAGAFSRQRKQSAD